MKSIKMLVASAMLVVSAPAFAEPVSIAKAAELGCHRIERLVTLKKIEAAFLDKFYLLRIEAINQGDAKFRFLGYQVPGADGSSKQLEIFMKEDGKAITHQVIEGAPGNALAWPIKDPVTLMETALHFVLENGPNKTEIAPFYNQLAEATLSQVQVNGELVAKTAFKAVGTSKTLLVLQKLDGTFLSAEVK